MSWQVISSQCGSAARTVDCKTPHVGCWGGYLTKSPRVHPVCLMLVGSMCVTSSMCFCTTQMKPKQHILSPWNNSVVDGKWSLMERLAELSVYVFMYFLDPQKGETSEFLWQLQSFPLEPPSCQNFNLFARKIGILIGRWWTPFNLDTPCVSCRSDLR